MVQPKGKVSGGETDKHGPNEKILKFIRGATSRMHRGGHGIVPNGGVPGVPSRGGTEKGLTRGASVTIWDSATFRAVKR
jgi:hypothetical protein